jgi:putative methyltransferase (TIGR04325 family)
MDFTARALVPPAALPALRRLRRLVRTPEWAMVAPEWPAQDRRGVGWAHPSIVETQRQRWPEFRAAVAGTAPLVILHEGDRVPTERFAYVVARAAIGHCEISVLDWGGGLGYHAVIARAAVPEARFHYTVHDLPGICDAGRELHPEVTFVSDAPALPGARHDLVVAINAAQYGADWPGRLAKLAAAAERFLFLDRLLLVRGAASFVIVQRPRRLGYHSEYLSWVFEEAALLAHLAAHGAVLDRAFAPGDAPTIAGAPAPVFSGGFLFRIER